MNALSITGVRETTHPYDVRTSLVAGGVARIPIAITNVYTIGRRHEPWFLVDTGIRGFGGRIIAACAERYSGRPPQAIILTHGHFDHAGNAWQLARHWNVPVYAHGLELPYLTGQSPYPPQDPTVGGFGGQLSRVYPNDPYDLDPYIQPLPDDGSIPGLAGWQVLHVPGHTEGQVALFREADRTLIAADVFITVNQDSPVGMMSRIPQLHGPPAYFTQDWDKAILSLYKVAALAPYAVGTGHGVPLRGPGLAEALDAFVRAFHPPRRGRYVPQPAIASEEGTLFVPPPAADPLPLLALTGLAVAGVLIVAARRGAKRGDTATSLARPSRPLVYPPDNRIDYLLRRDEL